MPACVLSRDPHALQYGPPFEPLKEHIVSLMSARGVSCSKEQLFLTTGAQQGMNLLARLLLDPGGELLVEEMAYPGFQQVIEPFQPRVLTVPTSPDEGMDLDAVEALLEKGERPAFIYAIADGHNPMAVSLDEAKRYRLVELARRFRVPIIEDDVYGFLSYDSARLPPLRAFDEQWVFYVGSFSKILAPALRVGWLIVPRELIGPLSVVKEATDIDTSTFTQRTVAAYLDAGHLAAHVSTLRSHYKARRDAMAGALREHFPAASRWREPGAGFFFWVELPERIDSAALLETALEREQVAYIPGRAFSVDGRGSARSSLRLNFSRCGRELIEEGIARLARVIDGVSP